MKSIERIIHQWTLDGLRLYVDGDNLRYEAKSGVLSADLLSSLRERKAELLEYLRSKDHPKLTYVECPDGVRIRTLQWGHTHLPCVVLIHGAGDTAVVWATVASQLACSYRIVAVELRGHGGSAWDPNGQYTVDKYQADIATAILQLGLKQPAIIGHSLGGNVAIRAAAADTSTGSLAIIDYGPQVPAGVAQFFNREQQLLLRRYGSPDELCEQLSMKLPLADPGDIARLAYDLVQRTQDGFYELRSDPEIHRRAIPHRSSELMSLLQGLRRPVLFLRGRASTVLSASAAAELSSNLPGSRLRTIENCGHAIPLENPKGLAKELLAFLDECQRGCTGAH
jgi:pimeloyl-ACP methyl ester carboxylesterase